MDVNVEKMFSLLKVPNEKIRDKLISDVKERVTSIRNYLGKEVSFNDIAKAMKNGFEEEFNVNLVEGELTEEETTLSEEFEREYFGSKQWNHKR